MKKRLLSLTLCLCLLCSVLAVPTMASHVCKDADNDGLCDSCWDIMPHSCYTCDGDTWCEICYKDMEHTCFYYDDYFFCSKCYEPKEHSCEDGDGDYRCDLCWDKVLHSCADTDKNYRCDLCDGWIEHDCISQDGDIWCDLCEDWMYHECVDEDGDYWCDLCEEWMEHECVDEDGDYWCDLCGDYVFAASRPSISGTVKSSLDNQGSVYIDIYDSYGDIINFAIFTESSADYDLRVYAGESYTVVVSKDNHVTRTYSLDMGEDPVELDLTIRPIGDASGDGKITVGDTAKIYAHIRGSSKLTDDYALKCADVTGDSKYTVGDTAKLYAHIRGTNKLW